MIKEIYFSTKKRYELIDITQEIERIVQESKIKDGFLFLFVCHSTASLLLTENEEGLKKDWLSFFKKLISGFDFYHNRIDNNADSHLLSGLFSQQKTFLISNGKIVRGTWQQIFLVEFDGPRQRKVIVKIKSD